MDIPPDVNSPAFEDWKEKRSRVERALEENGLRYYRFGRILPQGQQPKQTGVYTDASGSAAPRKPNNIDELLTILLHGLRRAMHPLTHRRRGAQKLLFSDEYDVQDLLHALLRPWVSDIRPEEFTPSYAVSSTRMDFLLPAHGLVIELKFVRDHGHARHIGDELIVDIEHYRKHPECDGLWCVVYDPEHFLKNPDGLRSDLEGTRKTKHGELTGRVLVL